MEYEHRYIMRKMLEKPMCAGYVFPTSGVIPSSMTVHHVDYEKAHNCVGNLMLLQRCIHNHISRAHQQYVRDHWEAYLENQLPF